MHFFNLFEYNLYDTAQIQYCTYVVYTQVCEWTMPNPHSFKLITHMFVHIHTYVALIMEN